MKRCRACDEPYVPLTDTEAVWLEFHRALHALGREIMRSMEAVADWLARRLVP